jgi:arylformamidase
MAGIERRRDRGGWHDRETNVDGDIVPVLEISHHLADGMATYPGLPAPSVALHTSHTGARSDGGVAPGFAIGRIDMVGNTGTYLDSPFHRFPDGDDVALLPLERLVDLPTTVVDASRELGSRAVDLGLSEDQVTDRAVLFRTGWDARWGTDDYWAPGPFLSQGVVDQLVAGRPAVVGVDCWNVDDVTGPDRPVHTRLLAAGVPIVEHLRGLGGVPDGARTFVVPLAVVGAPSIPVRAFVLG